MIRRREFIALVGGTAAAWPLTARAQQAGKLPVVGYLGVTTAAAQSRVTSAFVQRMRELGWIEGRTVAIEYRWAEGRTERFAEIAAEFVRIKVDVIVTSGAGVLAAKHVTSASSRRFGLDGNTSSLTRKMSSAIIVASRYVIPSLDQTDEVFGTHRAA